MGPPDPEPFNDTVFHSGKYDGQSIAECSDRHYLRQYIRRRTPRMLEYSTRAHNAAGRGDLRERDMYRSMADQIKAELTTVETRWKELQCTPR